MKHFASAISLVALGLLAAGASASAQENFYAGKRINVVVGFTPGGGYDAYARLLARHLGRYVPGKPEVIVQNLPGAASLNSVLTLDGNAPKDGTTIAAFNPGLLVESMTAPAKVKVKFTDFAWLGSIGEDLRVCFMWAGTGVKTWDDMLKRDPVVMGSTGRGSAAYINQKMLEVLFGVKLKQVFGYPGSTEKALAVERGELDGDCGSWTSVNESWLRDKKINLVIRFQKNVSRGLPTSVTYAGDLVKGDKRQLLDLLNAPSEIGRPYILSKAVPADRVKILRDAFDKTMEDKQFLEDAEKLQLIVSPIAGAEIEKMLKSLYATPQEVVAAAKEVSGD